MSEFHELIATLEHKANGGARLTREESLAILDAMHSPAPQIAWTQTDLDETVQHIFKHVDTQLETLLSAIGKFVENRMQPLRDRIDELEHRAANCRYVGIYQSGETYKLGSFCTHDGSLWHANADTDAKPGTNADWQLAVKRGKDAR